jgi:uncharacterized membrane protein YkoI
MQQAPWMLRIGWAMSLALLLAPMSRLHAAPETEVSIAHELSAAQATALVQKRYGARVVRAASSAEGGRHLYVFLLLSAGGKVWTVRIDARSGAEVP